MTTLLYNEDFASPSQFSKYDDEISKLSNLNRVVDSLNNKNVFTFEIKVDDTAREIPFLPKMGSFLILVQGSEEGMPTEISACTKSTSTAAGTVATLGSQVGTGSWIGNSVNVTANTDKFEVAHNLAATSGDFFITIIGVL